MNIHMVENSQEVWAREEKYCPLDVNITRNEISVLI